MAELAGRMRGGAWSRQRRRRETSTVSLCLVAAAANVRFRTIAATRHYDSESESNPSNELQHSHTPRLGRPGLGKT